MTADEVLKAAAAVNGLRELTTYRTDPVLLLGVCGKYQRALTTDEASVVRDALTQHYGATLDELGVTI